MSLHDENNLKKKCVVCFDDDELPPSSSCSFLQCRSCDSNLCSSCASTMSSAGSARIVVCPVPACRVPYVDADVARAIPTDLFDAMIQRRVDAKAAKALRDAERKINVAEEALLNANDDVLEKARARRACKHVNDQILTTKCPKCSTAFHDFDECFSLKCAAPDCGTHFCAWCLRFHDDNAQETHAHIARCTRRHEDANDMFFAPKALYHAVRKREQEVKLRTYLQTLPQSTRERVLEDDMLGRDLRERGLAVNEPQRQPQPGDTLAPRQQRQPQPGDTLARREAPMQRQQRQPQQMFYVTSTGSCWHASVTCSGLRNSRSTRGVAVLPPGVRPCRLCAGGAAPRPKRFVQALDRGMHFNACAAASVFVTPTGSCYHTSESCSSLRRSRNVRRTSAADVSARLRPCSLCS